MEKAKKIEGTKCNNYPNSLHAEFHERTYAALKSAVLTKLNITDADNALDLELAREVAAYFRLNLQEADATIEEFRSIVGQWRVVAQQVGLSASEQDRMAGAFRLADSDAASP